MDNKQAFGRITRRVTIEKSILTYRLCARELGVTVKQAKALLAAYLDTDQARERAASAVYCLSGYLKQDAADDQDGMDVDGEEKQEQDAVKIRTVMLVPAEDVEAKAALFSRPPSSHVYAVTPTPLAISQLTLLHTASLSLVKPEAREKWKPSPEADGEKAYGGIVHPDGERRRQPGQGGARGAPTSTAARAGSNGKGAETKPAVPKKEETKAAVKKEEKGKGKVSAAKGKAKDDKKKASGLKIGERRGLFGSAFDEPKKGKGKKKKESSDEEEEEEEEEESEEEVKPKKTVPAKRKSSPTATRSSSTTASSSKAPPAKPAPPPKKAAAAMVLDDEDDDDDWAMDEEALLEAERAAEKQAAEKAKKQAAGGSKTSTSTGGSKAGKKETAAERQKRELEEMMNDDDDMDIDGKKPAKKAPILSRSTSSSSSINKPHGKTSASSSSAKFKAGAAATKQSGIKGFFGKK
ncbi:hypothetical protein JCM11641_001903 [Rhodosporidiobolus odoratus]